MHARQYDARPTVTFPAAERHRRLTGTKLYCSVTGAQGCEQIADSLRSGAQTGSRTRDLFIGDVVIVWRERGKTIRSVLCNIVCNNCAQCDAHTHMNRLTVLWIGICLTGPISLC